MEYTYQIIKYLNNEYSNKIDFYNYKFSPSHILFRSLKSVFSMISQETSWKLKEADKIDRDFIWILEKFTIQQSHR